MIFIVKTITMNIRQIILEEINKTIMAQYAVRLEQYIGRFGIDTTPVGNNQDAIAYINNLSNFAFQVKDAIETENYEPQQNTPTGQYAQRASYGRSSTQNGGLVRNTVNGVANMANDTYDIARQSGLNGLDPVIGGVVTSFKKGYNDFNQVRDQITGGNGNMPQQQATKQQAKMEKTGVDLRTLMGQPYIQLGQDYNYVNQMNGNILYRVQAINNVFVILNDIKNALSQP
jgi:hypothetical protein